MKPSNGKPWLMIGLPILFGLLAFSLERWGQLGLVVPMLFAPLILFTGKRVSRPLIWVAALCAAVGLGAALMLSPGGPVNWSSDAAYAVAVLALTIGAAATASNLSKRERVTQLVHSLESQTAEFKERERLFRIREQEQSGRSRAMASVVEDLGLEKQKLKAQIAKRVRAERGEALYAAIIEACDDAILAQSLDAKITSWNQGAARLFGYSASEMIGHRIEEIILPDHLGNIRDKLSLDLSAQAGHQFETVITRKDGRSVDISVTISPVHDHEGALAGTSIIARDVTERNRAENLVRLSVEAAPSGMLMADQSGRIVMINSKIEEIFGYSRESLIGKPLEMLFAPEKSDLDPGWFQQFVVNPVALPMGRGQILTGLTRDRQRVPIEIGLTPVQTDRGLHVIAAVVDITERERMNSSLRSKNAELEQLMYVVSHDLKSPLVTVEGFANLLANHVGPCEESFVIDASERIQRGARTMGLLIESILELSRLSSKRLTMEPLDFHRVVTDAVEALEADINKAGATVELSPTLPATIFADQSQIARVLINLVGNAVKYGCPSPGSRVEIGGIASDSETTFYVRDFGPGISPKHHDRIFELFQRIARDGEGTGLGLASVMKAVKRHHGQVWIESAPSNGATFWVSLPLPRSAMLAPQALTPA